MFKIFFYFFIASTALWGTCFGVEKEGTFLSNPNAYRVIETMLQHHVEYGRFSPLLAKRSLKLFIEQFDPYRMYLLQSEISPFLYLTDEKLESIAKDHLKGRYLAYEEMGDLFQKAIERSRKIRKELKISILKGDLKGSGLTSDAFSKTEDDLRKKMHGKLVHLIETEKKAEGVSNFSEKERTRILDRWEERVRRVEETYLGKKNSAQFTAHILKAFAKALDAHSSFFSAEEAHDLRAALEKQFEGIGIVLRESSQGVVIKGVVKDSPADKIGKIQKGDLLIGIDGTPTSSLTYQEVLNRLKGGKGQQISLKFKRCQPVEEVFEETLVRAKVIMGDDRVQYRTIPFGGGVIGVIEIASFYESGDGSSCSKDVKEAISLLKSRGDLLGVILDLRENSGGFLNQAVKVASTFMSSGLVVVSKYAEGQMQYLRNIDGKVAYQGPLIVLTSKASASASEIVAQALQDYGVAVIVGDERTYGKGTIQYQTVTDKRSSMYFKVTVGKYYTVSGRSTQIKGVSADIHVPTNYAPFNIGEKYLLYPLKNDQIESFFKDPLKGEMDYSKAWMRKNYLPNIQKKLSFWTEVLPILKENSRMRIQKNKDFLSFLKWVEGERKEPGRFELEEENLGESDLQMCEAAHIIRDMAFLEKCKKKDQQVEK